jgi:hypothetical protein
MSEFASKAKSLVKKVLMIAIALFILLMLFFYYGNYSSGYRAGVATKISKKGVIFKTYEGTLNVGGLTNTSDGTIPTTWDFSVKTSDQEVLEKIDQAIQHSQRVKLLYKEKYVKLFWRGDTKYFVYDVEIINEQ